MIDIVLATKNANKVRELENILHPLMSVNIVPFAGEEPVENGTTFAENALIKARNAMQLTGKPAIADDSGIAVNILGGSPGIFSARWAGPEKSDQKNNDLLLWQLHDVREPDRGAAFICAAALVLPEEFLPKDGGARERTITAHWPGHIVTEPRGEHGFGYDPIFQPEGFEQTSGEMTTEQKNLISHRFLAFRDLAKIMTEQVFDQNS